MRSKKQNEHWNKLLPYEKGFAVAGAVCFLAFLILEVLKLLDRFGILLLGFDPTVALVSLLFVGQACELVVNWRTNHERAQYALFCDIFILGLGAMLAIVVIISNL